MKINEDNLIMTVSLDKDDFEKVIDEYKINRALLNLEKGNRPRLYITGYLGIYADNGTAAGFDSWAGMYGEPLDRLQIHINNCSKY
ncbi:hypothetical protein BTW26_06185 [Pediococcus acidilactici]|jgi:hypothetical protein|uniref:hypothetical protein n=1 Tax=Pediococcus acidilactici TaxID=1254 RepID=UPI00094730C6|nr:hypothetical protein [Pediococcus acidilactici]APR28623.1 hypothetical protein BTW26_06185 [Pediococcus acidilactici]